MSKKVIQNIMDKDEIIKKVEKYYNKSYNAVSGLHKKFNELEDMYWGYLPQNKNVARSNVYDPIAYEMVEHDVSHLLASIPTGYFKPVEDGDEENAYILSLLIKHQFNRPQANFLKSLRHMRRKASIYGTAFGLLTWKYERRYNKVYNKYYQYHNDPYFEDLDIYRCYPDTDATDVSDMEYFIYEDYTTIDNLKAENFVYKTKDGKQVSKYINLEELEKEISSNKTIDLGSYRNNAFRRQGINKGDGINKILIRRCFTRDRWYSVAVDYKMVIEDRPNPYYHNELPVHILKNVEFPGLLYGVSDLLPLQKMITAYNQFLNMRMDNIRLIMNPPYTVREKALKFEQSWQNIPGNINIVEDLNDMQVNYTPDTTASTFIQTMNYFLDQIARRAGRLDFLSRNESSYFRTATEIKLMAGEQNARKKYKISLFEEFYTKLMAQAVDLNQQFLITSKVIRLLGDEVSKIVKNKDRLQQNGNAVFFKIKPEDISGRYDYVVDTESSVSAEKELEISKISEAIKTVTQFIPILAQSNIKVNLKPLLEKYLREIGVRFIDKIFEDINVNILSNDGGNQQTNGSGIIPAGQVGAVQEVEEQLRDQNRQINEGYSEFMQRLGEQ